MTERRNEGAEMEKVVPPAIFEAPPEVEPVRPVAMSFQIQLADERCVPADHDHGDKLY